MFFNRKQAYSKFEPVAKNGLPDYVRGSESWIKWIDEQKHYFEHGYDAGGDHITGRMYFYLNFNTIQRLNEKKYKVDFNPSYVDSQREIFDVIEECLRTGEYDVLVGKARDKGFSYIIAALALYETQLQQGSSVLALFPGGQSDAQMLFKQKYDIAHGNLLSDFKHFPDLKNTKEEYYYGFEETDDNGQKQDSGILSRLKMVPAVNADVGKGARPKIILMEEFGELKNPLALIRTNQANMREGDVKFGLTIAGGTSNAMNDGYKDFRELRYKSEELGFKWIFIAAQKMYFPFVNEETGESDEEGAKVKILKRREGLVGEQLMIEQQNYPTSEEEMFTAINKSPFNPSYCARQIGRIKTDKTIQIQVGDLVDTSSTTVEFRLNPKGLWKILRHPLKNAVSPDVIGIDPYRLGLVKQHKDMSSGAIVVRRPFQGIGEAGQMPIAICKMRTEDKDLFFAECVKGEKYWGAMALIEYTDEDIFDYHTKKGVIKYVCKAPQILEAPWATPTNKYGWKVTEEAKGKAVEIAVKDFNANWENIFFEEILEDYSNFGEENTDIGMAAIGSIVNAVNSVTYTKPKIAARKQFFKPYCAIGRNGQQIVVNTLAMDRALRGLPADF